MNSSAVQFHRESNFFTLANPHLSLRFSIAPPGSLVSLSSPSLGVEVFHTPLAVATAETWRIELPRAPGLGSLGSRRGQKFSHDFSLDADGAGCLQMEWRNLLLAGQQPARSPVAEIPVSVGLTLLLPADSPLCFGRVRLQLPPEIDKTGLTFVFPNFSGLRPPEPEATSLFLPVGDGLLITHPAANLSSLTEWLYPGELTMQFAGLHILSHEASLYFAAQDGKGAIKGLRAGPDERGNLSLSLLNFPFLEASGSLQIGYELAFGLLAGGWPQAARTYRGWAREQAWGKREEASAKKSPAESDNEGASSEAPSEEKYRGLWLLARGSSHHVVAAAMGLQREANTPVRLLWQWWQGCPGGSLYPDYLPPRDEEEAFSQALALLKEAGIQAFPGLDAAAASPRSSAWEPLNLKSLASLSLTGALQETKDNPFSADALAAMCPANGEWPALLNKICSRLRRLGAQGAWLDKITTAGAGLRCFSTDHPHPAGAGDHFINSLAAISCPLIASDPAEIFLGRLQAVILTSTSREREGRPKGLRSDDWEPIPLLQAVYSPDLYCVGIVGPLNNLFPQDPLWPVPAARPRAAEASLLREEHSLQLTLEAARTLLWGYQPALADFDPLLLREHANVRKLAFLRTLLQLDAMEPIASRGEFLGPIITDCSPMEADFLVNSLYSLAGQRRSYTRLLPSVVATAWRARPDKLLLVLVNLQENETEFACVLPLSRLGISSPGKVYGLTFSPELGGKPASLSLAEEKISGRLPAHSASIVWL